MQKFKIKLLAITKTGPGFRIIPIAILFTSQIYALSESTLLSTLESRDLHHTLTFQVTSGFQFHWDRFHVQKLKNKTILLNATVVFEVLAS